MTIEEKLNFKTLDWRESYLRLIDQRQLPERLAYFDCYNSADVIYAIKNLVVRGAPAIGCAAAYGIALAAKNSEDIGQAARNLKTIRPTAINLAWAIERMIQAGKAASPETLEKEAIAIHAEDGRMCQQIGRYGAELIKNGHRIITHCNAGALATGGIGTALGVIYTAFFSGKNISVWVDETRPVLQGARLTTWELERTGVPYTLICDSNAASLMSKGLVDCAITGADRIAINYDVANKIGTYSLAVLCRFHKIPFYVAAPSSTFDPTCPNGDSIIIENRPEEEVKTIQGSRIAPESAKALNPAFDITPHDLITAIITENEVIKP